MLRTKLTDEDWFKLKPILLDLGIYDKGESLRMTVEGILYRARVGCPWRDLPSEFGNHNTIHKTFRRWAKNGNLLKLFEITRIPDFEWMFIDGTHTRVHQHGSNVANAKEEAISKSVGGNSSKIHLAVDANGVAIDFIVTDGTTHDVKVAPELIEKIDLTETECLSADKGYDSEDLREQIEATQTQANIPRKCNSKSDNEHMDWYHYKLRHLVENAFARLKHFRAIATRYDKLKQSYEATIALVCAYLQLKYI